MKTAIELIAAERARQIEQKGFTPEHDERHVDAELVDAALCYAEAASCQINCPEVALANLATNYDGTVEVSGRSYWPFEEAIQLSEDPISNLIKAGALICAEIDRLRTKK